MPNNYKIRFIRQDDLEQFITLCELHAQYEKAEYSAAGKLEKLQKVFFSDSPKLFGLVVESGSELKGFATYMTQYSTWNAEEYVYLDCLFLVEEIRAKGIGKNLMTRVKQEAKRLGCTLIQWQTPDFNEGAIRFYKRLGAKSKDKKRFYWNI